MDFNFNGQSDILKGGGRNYFHGCTTCTTSDVADRLDSTMVVSQHQPSRSMEKLFQPVATESVVEPGSRPVPVILH